MSRVDGQESTLDRDLGVANWNGDLRQVGQVLDCDIASAGHDQFVECHLQVAADRHFGRVDTRTQTSDYRGCRVRELDRFDLDRKGIRAREIGMPERSECCTNAACLVKIESVRVVGGAKGCIGQDTVLDRVGIRVLNSRRDGSASSGNNESVVGSTEGNQVLSSRFGVDGGSKGQDGVVRWAVDDR